ncbi:MAG: NifB/NifX family molybdenum-iron cluster-binding protein [Planctomycetota bacterium]
MKSEDKVLRVAVAAADELGLDGPVSAHFGRCPAYVVAEVRGEEVTGNEVVANPHFANHAPGQVPRFLADLRADVVLAGGMGPRAVHILQNHGIEVATGATGTIRDAIHSWIRGTRGITPCAGDHPDSCGHGHGHGHEGGKS